MYLMTKDINAKQLKALKRLDSSMILYTYSLLYFIMKHGFQDWFQNLKELFVDQAG